MSGSAKVHSLDAIGAVRSSLLVFREQLEQSLSEIAIEMRRVQDWLEHDRPRYWRGQVRRAMDEVTAARAALHRCLMYPVADERPSCREERAELDKAQAHLAYCQEKEERLKHWTREVRHELFEYEGRIGQLMELVEIDTPQAISILDRLLARLREYQAIRAADNASYSSVVSLANELWPEKVAMKAEAGEADEAKTESNAVPSADEAIEEEGETT
jgi:hypothetical protein